MAVKCKLIQTEQQYLIMFLMVQLNLHIRFILSNFQVMIITIFTKMCLQLVWVENLKLNI